MYAYLSSACAIEYNTRYNLEAALNQLGSNVQFRVAVKLKDIFEDVDFN